MQLGFLVLLGLGCSSLAQHVHYQIPQVAQDAQYVRSRFHHWQSYRKPTGTATKATETGTPPPSSPPPASACSYWLEEIDHQGLSPFHPDPTAYQVFRNVKDFGAKGDGSADDTAAINNAISSGGRCAPGSCQSSTTSPAVVYFPAGTYLLTGPLIDYYETQLIGNPNCLPILRPLANFTNRPGTIGVIDGDPYGAGGLGFGSTNVFYRQIRNFIIDMTNIPSTSPVTGIHWPTAQSTSLQNVVFQMSDAPGTQHLGILIEEGSGGLLNDLVFYGGLNGASFGNQQFTMRNLTFYNAVTAINQLWDWGWTYKSISINNCSTGLNMSSINAGALTVGSVTFIDSSISNTKVGIATARGNNSQPKAAGSLILENVQLQNVPVAVSGPRGSTLLAGSTNSMTINAWGEGNSYTPDGPTPFQGSITPFTRPSSLLEDGGKFYERSKPQYATTPLSQVRSVRSAGAKGDGVTDDTAAIQQVLTGAATENEVVFFDFGVYKVTETIYIPPGSKIVGESYSVILSSGKFFADVTNPKPAVCIGNPGETGSIEWSDMIVSTEGYQAGAVLFEVNLAASSRSPTGLWDVHARIGGFTGSSLQVGQCPTTPTATTPPAPVKTDCIAAYLTMHVTRSASGLYLENVWLWTADHDLDDASSTQITVYTGRGLYIESTSGTIWLVGTAVEHHALYQYQFANTSNIFAGLIQTETAYYQPNPNATIPFPAVVSLNDPNTTASSQGIPGNSADGWGLRIVDSQNILIYSAGHYSFFNNYNTSCSAAGNGETCQTMIVDIENSSNINVYNLNTVGATSMVNVNGKSLASYTDNVNVFPDTIALFQSN
ncbi:MAG: hypothetical protein Q9191_004507 [Dirinaria sp. TL-2023a]